MQKEKMNLQEVRSFSDSITAAFLFVKQEFKPLITGFAALVLPVIFVDMFVKSFTLRSLWSAEAAVNSVIRVGLSYLLSLLMFFVLILFVSAYLRLYDENFRNKTEERITVAALGKEMYSKALGMLGLYVIYLLAVTGGLAMLLVPGIYLSVAFAFCFYYLGIRGKSISGSLGESMETLKGHWWSLFAFMLVMQVMVSMLSYVFSLPYVAITIKSVALDGQIGIYESALGILIANIGQYFLYLIFWVGLGIRFFSVVEQKEHIALLDRIGQIGNDSQIDQSEKIY